MLTKFQARAFVVCSQIIALLLLVSCQPIQAPTPDMTAAFVRNRTLYIQSGRTVTGIEACSLSCHVYYLTWSPDGEKLAYFYSPASAAEPFSIRITDRAGSVRTVAEGVGWITPPAWSPDGQELAYFIATDRYVVQEGTPRYVVEVWTSEIGATTASIQARKRGEVSIGGDCGGGGRSESAMRYEEEGGLAYGGYLAGVLAWAADDILLYSNHCSARGIGRFDLATGTELEPYAGNLSSLAFNRARDHWVAIDEDSHLVLGSPSDLSYETIATRAIPELVFYGQGTDELFYTVLTTTGKADLFENSSAAQQSIPISPYFEFTQPELHRLRPPTEDHLLWKDDGYAYARVQQSGDGTIYFMRVGNSESIYRAMESGTLTAENLDRLRPTVDVLRLTPGREQPERWLTNVGQFSIAPIAAP